MRKLHVSGFDTADWIIQGLANLNLLIQPDTRILDFGCGEGALVYRFREYGYSAYGFDIHRYGKLKDAPPEDFFRFFDNPLTDRSDHTVSPSNYAIPFENESFDLVFSSQTLEHVLEPAPVMAEIARVLSPDGVAVHLYPDRKRPIEPHFFVPFATRIRSWWWLYLWAILGVRSSYQEKMTTRQVADANFRYLQTGVRYFTDAEMKAFAAPYFREVSFPQKAFYCHRDHSAVRHAVWQALRTDRPLENLAMLPKLNVLFTAKKRGGLGWRILAPFRATANGYLGRLPKALSGALADSPVLFHDHRLAGCAVTGDEPDTLIVAPSDWSLQQVMATKIDVAAAKLRKLDRQFRDHPGHMFGAYLPDLAHLADDAAPDRESSPLLMFEDKQQLRYPHSLHVDISDIGAGRFSHWRDEVLFSTTDNSDPRTNGRTYEIVIMERD